MSSNPKVSIICVSYNQEGYIRETLEGFVSQKTDFDFEVVISDDCSTDKTPAIIEEYVKKYPDIFRPVLKKKNVGVVRNFISVLTAAKGKYIALCEGDDYWTDPQKLQTQVDFLEKNPRYVGCFHRVKVVYEGNEKADSVFPGVEDRSWYTIEELLKTNYIPTNSAMYRRQDYSKLATNIMPFDWYLHLYHAQFGEIALIDKVMSVYRKHGGGIWWEYDVNRDEIWKKYGLAYLAMFDNVSKMYNKNPKRRAIIDETINETLGILISVDEKYGTSLLEKALAEFPERQQPFMVYQHGKLEEKSHELDAMRTQLLKVGDEKAALAVERDLAAREINRMANTRTWKLRTKTGRIIKGKKRR